MIRKMLLSALLVAAYSSLLTAQAQPQPAPPADQKEEPPANARGNLEVLSDTMGVNFGPYLQRLQNDIKTYWYAQMPEVAKPPIMKPGIVTLEFAIMKDGKVSGLKYFRRSGDFALDRAAWAAITAGRLLPLPQEFHGSYLVLRIKFQYNPGKLDSIMDSDHPPAAKQ